mmetsp:Transcript_15353/g.33869  ORF Transcript_15353/g.33869 Transcript_15353/m.33869 type:complete len:229 (+) Transcript_15353:340-1026(+)
MEHSVTQAANRRLACRPARGTGARAVDTEGAEEGARAEVWVWACAVGAVAGANMGGIPGVALAELLTTLPPPPPLLLPTHARSSTSCFTISASLREIISTGTPPSAPSVAPSPAESVITNGHTPSVCAISTAFAPASAARLLLAANETSPLCSSTTQPLHALALRSADSPHRGSPSTSCPCRVCITASSGRYEKAAGTASMCSGPMVRLVSRRITRRSSTTTLPMVER